MTENDTDPEFLERFQEFLDYGNTIFDDEEESGIIPNVCSSTTNDTMCTTYENISLTQTNNDAGGTVPREQRCASSNTTLSEWDVISSGNTPIKSTSLSNGVTTATSSTVYHPHEQLSDIREEEQKSSSGISSSATSTLSMNSNRSVTPVFFDSKQLGIPQLKLTNRFMVAFVSDASSPFQFSVSLFEYREREKQDFKYPLILYKWGPAAFSY